MCMHIWVGACQMLKLSLHLLSLFWVIDHPSAPSQCELGAKSLISTRGNFRSQAWSVKPYMYTTKILHDYHDSSERNSYF